VRLLPSLKTDEGAQLGASASRNASSAPSAQLVVRTHQRGGPKKVHSKGQKRQCEKKNFEAQTAREGQTKQQPTVAGGEAERPSL